ncbi:MAG: helix-turn-helix domain-containing protein [Egibacteraceae bacterium]
MEHEAVGERIAYWRRRRGLSQKVLAGLVGRSASWMTKVEGGDRIVDKLSVLLALSYALKVDLGKLIGGVELPPNGGGPSEPPRGIVAVRRALSRSARPTGSRLPSPSCVLVSSGPSGCGITAATRRLASSCLS